MLKKSCNKTGTTDIQKIQTNCTLSRQVFIDSTWSGYFILLPIFHLAVTHEAVHNVLFNSKHDTLREFFTQFLSIFGAADELATAVIKPKGLIDNIQHLFPLFYREKNSALIIKKAGDIFHKLPPELKKNTTLGNQLYDVLNGAVEI